jgi:predicted TIM-barrel fold metal-dependent hydrolase
MRIAALLALSVGLIAAPAAAQGPRPGMGSTPGQMPSPPTVTRAATSWIDVHVHLVTGRTRGGPGDYLGAVEAALKEMDRFRIATSIVLPPPQIDEQRPYDLEAFASAIRPHGRRFAMIGGGGALNSIVHRHADPKRVAESVKREFALVAEKILSAGAVGFGEMASLHLSATQGHPYEYVPADHPLFLLLADIAARRDVPIDLHMDPVDGETPTPPFFRTGNNPPVLPDTIGALGRLLAYNPKARIVWAHGGSDPVGAMTAALIGRTMDTHPNLYVSLRIVGAQAPNMTNTVFGQGGLDPAWESLLARHADRFVIGSDSFWVAPGVQGSGPGITFSARNLPKLQATVRFLSLLPPAVAAKLSHENAQRLYRLAER